MRYINTVTGAIIDSPCVISGGDWSEYSEETNNIKSDESSDKVDLGSSDVGNEQIDEPKGEDIEDITKKEIMQELDALGIKYNPKSSKKELYDLMIGGK